MRRFLLVLMFLIPVAGVTAQKTKIMIMEIKSEIDPRTNRYVELALAHAEKSTCPCSSDSP